MTLSFTDPIGRGRELLERLGTDDAVEMLRAMDKQEDANALLDDLGERFGDFDEAEGRLKLLERIEAAAERHDALTEMPGDDLSEQITAFAEMAADYEQQHFALMDLLHEAGLLNPNDFKSDPLPLLRMFLPV